jgi:hypothetical protein
MIFKRERPVMNNLVNSISHFQTIKTRLKQLEPEIDNETLADTVEGLTDLHEVIAATIRAALMDETFAQALRLRIKEMQERLARLERRAVQKREICRDAMVQAEIKKIAAPDVTISLRPGTPSLVIADEKLVPIEFWEPQPARLRRQEIINELKRAQTIPGAELAESGPVLSVRSK